MATARFWYWIAICLAVSLCTPLAGQTADNSGDEKNIIEVPYRILGIEGKSNWFGYYDKLQFDPSNRYVLSMQVDFDNRAPKPEDTIRLGMFDLQDNDKWIEFGETTAWCWQQGCMLQWIPGSNNEVIYNARQDGKFVSIVQNVFTDEKRVLPKPIYAVSPNGKEAVGLDFSRVNSTRPGYGYCGIQYDWEGRECPHNDGIYRIGLQTGMNRLIVALKEAAAIQHKDSMDGGGRHWFNHLLYNPDGSRFIFLHRWYRNPEGKGGWSTRMLTCDRNGGNIHVVADHNMVSHFIWRDPKHILAWSKQPEIGDRFWLYTDQSDEKEIIGDGVFKTDGHCTYSPDGQWILADTYPNKERLQNLKLYRPSDGKVVQIGKFYLPPELKGQMRTDLHPGWSRDGKYICIDSAHTGHRQMILLDVGDIIHQ